MLTTASWLGQKYNQLNKAGQAASAAETVKVLAERLKTASEPEDLRATVLSLKGLSRDYPKQIGDHALPAILSALEKEAAQPPVKGADDEIVRALVETCITLCDTTPPSPPEGVPKPKVASSGQHSLALTDVFLERPEPVQALLPLLSSRRTFYTRFASLQLLGTLLRNRAARVQEHILVAPGGCGAILECVAEDTTGPGGLQASGGARSGSSAEIIRNEALLVLPHLVHGNPDIQKLVAFEGAFDKLLDVVAQEGRIEGGVVVQDALEGLEALLRYNVSNQNYFRETMSVPMLAPLLFFPPPPPSVQQGGPSRQAEQEHARQLEAFAFQEWDEQKVLNARLVIGIAGLLVSGQGAQKRSNQNALLQSGTTRCLVELALASTAPVLLKSQALHVLSSMLSASRPTQELVSELLISPLLARESPQPEPIAAEDSAVDPEGNPVEQSAPAVPPAPILQFTRLPARPAVLALIGTALNGLSLLEAGTNHAQLGMRAVALSCFESLTADNMDVRMAIISGMMPDTSNDDQSITAGGLLLDTLRAFPTSERSGDVDPEHSGFDAYKYLIASILFAHLVKGSDSAKRLVRNIAVDHEGKVSSRNLKEGEEPDEDDPRSGLLQVIMGNFTMAIREQADAVRKDRSATASGGVATGSSAAADWTRVLVGYLILLATWLWDSPSSVRDFLQESANLQVLIQPVAQSSGIDPLIQSLSAFVLGIIYEFNTQPGDLDRATMHPILHTRIGADNFGVRLLRLRDDPRFRAVGPDVLERIGDDPALAKEEKHDGLWFDWTFVEFWKINFLLVQKSILVDPQTTSADSAKASAELLDAQRQVDALKDQVAKQAHEIEHLEQNLSQSRKEREEEKRSFEEQLVRAQEASRASEESLSALHRELSSVHAGHEAVLSDAQKQREGVAVELDGVKGALVAAGARIAELEKRAGEAEEEKTRAVEELESAKRDAAAEREKESEGQDAESKKAIDELEAKVTELSGKLEHAEQAKSVAEKAREEADTARRDAEEEAEKAKKDAAAAAAETPKAKEVNEDDESRAERVAELEKENEDLLVLLEELSSKRRADKAKMREKGMEVSEDEDDDEEGEDEQEEAS